MQVGKLYVLKFTTVFWVDGGKSSTHFDIKPGEAVICLGIVKEDPHEGMGTWYKFLSPLGTVVGRRLHGNDDRKLFELCR